LSLDADDKIAPINMFILAVESFKADDLLKQYCKVENREEEALATCLDFLKIHFSKRQI
jgi:hypothetical protein